MPTRARAGRTGARRKPAPAPEGPARERILVAALGVFAEHGFDGARTRDIADRAGANLGLIKYYFDTKEKLWRAAVALAFEELQAEMGEAVTPVVGEPADPRAQLERILRRFVRFVARRPEFMRLMNDEGKREGPRMRWLTDRYVRPLTDTIHAALGRATGQGVLPPVSAAILHYIALGAAGLAFSQAPECAYLTGIDPTSDAFAEAHADALVALLLAAATARPVAARPRSRPKRTGLRRK
jgi:TetR/AcrR family transcriptional regulator